MFGPARPFIQPKSASSGSKRGRCLPLDDGTPVSAAYYSVFDLYVASVRQIPISRVLHLESLTTGRRPDRALCSTGWPRHGRSKRNSGADSRETVWGEVALHAAIPSVAIDELVYDLYEICMTSEEPRLPDTQDKGRTKTGDDERETAQSHVLYSPPLRFGVNAPLPFCAPREPAVRYSLATLGAFPVSNPSAATRPQAPRRGAFEQYRLLSRSQQ